MTGPPGWQPETQYNYGDIVEYECVRYKIIQPHRSQGDWTPPATPALWGCIPDKEWDNHAPYNPPHDKGDYHQQDVHPPDDCGHQNADVPQEEQKKKWYELDDNRKKQLEVGGGLAAGLAILGGGYYAYHEQEKKKTEGEKQALTWGVQGWHKDSYARTEEFRNHGPRAPTTWVLVDGPDKIPKSALEAGRDKDDHPIYIARAYYEDGIHVAKASPAFNEGAAITYGTRAVDLNKFEVLIGDPRAVRWVPHSGLLKIQQLGATPVEGGREANGAGLYIARVRYDDGVHTAKCAEHLPGAHLAFSGNEVLVNDYEVLCLN